MTGQEFRQEFVRELFRLGWTEYWSDNQEGALLQGAGKEGWQGRYLVRSPRHWAANVSVTKLHGCVNFTFDSEQDGCRPRQKFPRTEAGAKAAAKAMVDAFAIAEVHGS